MTEPRCKATVYHEGQGDGGMDPEGDSKEASREKYGILDGVETCARESGGVVAPVVQLVDVLVQEATLGRS